MASPPVPDFEELLARLGRVLRSHDLPFMLIGGQAVLLHGEPRLTQNIDVTLGASPERLPDVLAACAALSLQVLPEDAADFVRDTFVLPVSDEATGIRVDLIFSSTAYEAEAIARAVLIEIKGQPVPFATAEDLILHKLFAGRPRDLEDARGVVRRKGPELDWEYLRHWAAQFALTPGRESLPVHIEELQRALDDEAL